MTQVGVGTGYFPLVVVAFVCFGVGLDFVPLLTLALADVEARDAGTASALINVSLYISGAIGLTPAGRTRLRQVSRPAGTRRRPARVRGRPAR